MSDSKPIAADTRVRRWVEENAGAFARQAVWHENNGHPLCDVLAGPVAETWKD